MKRHVPIDIPVKPYIKAFMRKELGEVITLSPGQHVITNKIYDILEHHQNKSKHEAPCNYGDHIRIYLTYETFRRRGFNLNNSNIKSFNRFVEKLVKFKFYTIMDSLIDILPSFEANISEARNRIGIDIDFWSDESMRKDYYRYRLKAGKPLLYDKTFGRIVPSEKSDDAAF